MNGSVRSGATAVAESGSESGVRTGFLPQGLQPMRASLPRLQKLPQNLDAWVHRMHGRHARRAALPRQLAQLAAQCTQRCAALDALDEAALDSCLDEVRRALRRDPADAKGQLVEALAVVGQLSCRALQLRPYTVQFMAALAMHRGHLAEMATGEGKTLTVALAAVLSGLSGRPCHVVTANDYLAQRDAEEMRGLFTRCGIRASFIVADLSPEERANAYDAEVVYVAPKELLADFLRDQLAFRTLPDPARQVFRRWLGVAADHAPSASQTLVRGLHSVIVDEADSVLIDEAVTPLILSMKRPSPGLSDAVQIVARVADTMQVDSHYVPEPRIRSVRLTEAAQSALAELEQILPPVWRAPARREALLRQALTARAFFRAGHQYLVIDGEVVLIDEFTGRLTPGRSLTAGLHQAIEAREGVAITDPNESLAQMSFQAFFRGFRRLAGCTGTAWETREELWQVYRLAVLRIPTHRPRRVEQHPPQLHVDKTGKWRALAQHLLDQKRKGRPVLVGVRSVSSSLALAEQCRALDVPVAVLNAEQHAEEAEIIALAAHPGQITIATNMAGRGTDIRLDDQVRSRGGLHVVIAETNESGRIDRQLAGRCGRQGDPGSVVVWYCLEDDVAGRFLPGWVCRTHKILYRLASTLAVSQAGWIFTWAQRRAERDAYRRRMAVLKSDDWLASALPFEVGDPP